MPTRRYSLLDAWHAVERQGGFSLKDVVPAISTDFEAAQLIHGFGAKNPAHYASRSYRIKREPSYAISVQTGGGCRDSGWPIATRTAP